VTTQERRGETERQQVVDPDHHCNWSPIPHLLLEHVAAGALKPTSLVLYAHYKRIAWEQHGRPIAETLRETKHRTNLSNGTILAARRELAKTGWITVQIEGQRRDQLVTVSLIERWTENCPGHTNGQNLTKDGAIGQIPAIHGQKPAIRGRNLTKAHHGEHPLKTLEDIEDPLGGDNDGPRGGGHQNPLPAMALIEVTACSAEPAAAPCSGEDVLAGLYRGLGVKPSTLTERVYRRELQSAQDLAAKGATAAEAEAYARETNVPGRRAAVDMNSFEHERASWLSRRQRGTAQPLLRVANGRMPE
jgi:hypothetical protein